jgi:hypothetical protein
MKGANRDAGSVLDPKPVKIMKKAGGKSGVVTVTVAVQDSEFKFKTIYNYDDSDYVERAEERLKNRRPQLEVLNRRPIDPSHESAGPGDSAMAGTVAASRRRRAWVAPTAGDRLSRAGPEPVEQASGSARAGIMPLEIRKT